MKKVHLLFSISKIFVDILSIFDILLHFTLYNDDLISHISSLLYSKILNIISVLQGYDEDSDDKRSTNMNMGPRTWYQVPRDLRYPEVSV